jgi:ABC-type transporter Mla subunit MlaD
MYDHDQIAQMRAGRDQDAREAIAHAAYAANTAEELLRSRLASLASRVAEVTAYLDSGSPVYPLGSANTLVDIETGIARLTAARETLNALTHRAQA